MPPHFGHFFTGGFQIASNSDMRDLFSLLFFNAYRDNPITSPAEVVTI